MKTFTRGIWFILCVFIVFNMSACVGVDGPMADIPSRVAPIIKDGIMLEINTSTVANGIGGIATGVSESAKVLRDPAGTQFVFTWPMNQVGQAWVSFDGKIATPISHFLDTCGGKGNVCSLNTWKQLEGLLKDSGWTELGPDAKIQIAKTVYIVLVGLSSKEFVMPVMITPLAADDGSINWSEFFEDAIRNQMCAPLYRSDGTQFNPCAVGSDT
jgi:hypothetical protein